MSVNWFLLKHTWMGYTYADISLLVQPRFSRDVTPNDFFYTDQTDREKSVLNA